MRNLRQFSCSNLCITQQKTFENHAKKTLETYFKKLPINYHLSYIFQKCNRDGSYMLTCKYKKKTKEEPCNCCFKVKRISNFIIFNFKLNYEFKRTVL